MPSLPKMPKWVMPALAIAFTLSLVPLLLITRARSTTFEEPRIHWIPDMDHQHKYVTQSSNPLFADNRAMRTPPQGTVARGRLEDDDHLYRGVVDGDWVREIPMPLSATLMARGQERYQIYCAPCHGLDGDGRGMVSLRAEQLQEPTWVQPASFHTELVRGRADGHLYNTITNGIRSMPPYGSQISVEDRWAIVAYVRALQRSQNAALDEVPAQFRRALR